MDPKLELLKTAAEEAETAAETDQTNAELRRVAVEAHDAVLGVLEDATDEEQDEELYAHHYYLSARGSFLYAKLTEHPDDWSAASKECEDAAYAQTEQDNAEWLLRTSRRCAVEGERARWVLALREDGHRDPTALCSWA